MRCFGIIKHPWLMVSMTTESNPIPFVSHIRKKGFGRGIGFKGFVHCTLRRSPHRYIVSRCGGMRVFTWTTKLPPRRMASPCSSQGFRGCTAPKSRSAIFYDSPPEIDTRIGSRRLALTLRRHILVCGPYRVSNGVQASIYNIHLHNQV